MGSSRETMNTDLENEQGSYIPDGWQVWRYSSMGIQHGAGGDGVLSI